MPLSRTLHLVIFAMLCGYLAIDSLNGVMLRVGLPSISLAWKVLILALSCFYLINASGVGLTIAVLLLYHVVHTLSLIDIIAAASGLVWLIKSCLIFIVFLYFKQLIDHGESKKVFNFFYISFAILIANILLGLMGFGYAQYGEGRELQIGTRGFIYAGNELGVALLIASASFMLNIVLARRYAAFIATGVIVIFCGAAIASKVSILSSLLVFFTFPLITFFINIKDNKIPRKEAYLIGAFTVCFPIVLFGGLYYALYEANLISRLSYMYERLDLVTLILSHRNIWTMEALDIFINQYSFIQQLFGSGQEWVFLMAEQKSVELDAVDYLMSYGIVGALLAYGIWFVVISHTFINQHNPLRHYLVFLHVLLIAVSLTSGHVLNSGTAGPLLGALCALGYLNSAKTVAR